MFYFIFIIIYNYYLSISIKLFSFNFFIALDKLSGEIFKVCATFQCFFYLIYQYHLKSNILLVVNLKVF